MWLQFVLLQYPSFCGFAVLMTLPYHNHIWYYTVLNISFLGIQYILALMDVDCWNLLLLKMAFSNTDNMPKDSIYYWPEPYSARQIYLVKMVHLSIRNGGHGGVHYTLNHGRFYGRTGTAAIIWMKSAINKYIIHWTTRQWAVNMKKNIRPYLF